MRSILWPEFLLKVDHILHTLARNVYAKAPGLDDRAIERPFLFRHIPSRGRVLDVGCTGSDLPMVLSAFGYDVVGLDGRPYQVPDPPFTFARGDIRRTTFPDGSFDIVTAISTIEHIGLSGRYGADEDSEGDMRSMAEIRRLCRPGGRVILTVPYGRPAVFRPWHRVYGPNELASLVDGFRVVASEFFVPDERGLYTHVDQDVASDYRSHANIVSGRLLDYAYALACLVLERP